MGVLVYWVLNILFLFFMLITLYGYIKKRGTLCPYLAKQTGDIKDSTKIYQYTSYSIDILQATLAWSKYKKCSYDTEYLC